MITVIDLEGFSLFGGDSRFNKAMGQASEMSAVYYPQVRAHRARYRWLFGTDYSLLR